MAGINKNDLKIIVKQCVMECLREIIAEQVDPAGLLETLSRGRAASNARSNSVVNPFDDDALRTRELARQQLLKQSSAGGRRMTEGLERPAKRSNDGDSGYINPSDRLKQIAPPRQKTADPMLDAPVNGSRIAPVSRGAVTDFSAPSPEVLKGLLDDTAKTTYAEQASHGHVRPSRPEHDVDAAQGFEDHYAEVVGKHSPDELFENAGSWANLAFR